MQFFSVKDYLFLVHKSMDSNAIASKDMQIIELIIFNINVNILI